MIRPPENEQEMRRFYQDLCAKTNQIDTFYNVRGVNYVSGQDITSEINNAVSDVIVIPPGTYTISSDITLTNKTLTGSGTLNFTGSNEWRGIYLINTVGTHGISGITVINGTIWISSSTNAFISDCTIKEIHTESAIIVRDGSSNIHITGNKIIDTGKDQPDSSGIFVCGHWGGPAQSCTDVIVANNILIEAGQLGIESWALNRRVVISDNVVKGSSRVNGFGISVSTGDDHVVSNNIVEETTLAMSYGIEVAGGDRALIQGNIVRGTNIGIDVNSASDGCILDGNLLYSIRGYGIRTWGTKHIVTNNLIQDCAGQVFYNQNGTDIFFKNNIGNSVSVNTGQAIFNDTGTCWAEGNHITAITNPPVQSYNTGAVLTMKNNYFGLGGVGSSLTQELSGGKIKIFGHVTGQEPFGLHDVVETGATFSPAMRFLHIESATAFTIRIKFLRTSSNQPAASFMVFWSSRETNTARGGLFIVSYGSAHSYNDTPVLTQMGDTVTPVAVAYDTDSYPYWDFTMSTNNYTNQAMVHAIGQHALSGEYIISAV